MTDDTSATLTVLVAGAHGRVARRLLPLLTGAGHAVRGLIRNADHTADVEAIGVEGVVLDLETNGVDACRRALTGCDAVVFAAGAGPGSGAARKITVDLDGAVKLIEAAEAEGVPRYLMLSAMSADDPDRGPEALRPYLVAKGGADARLRRSSLDWTIVRPGRLTDDDPTGAVDAAPRLDRRGEISRADVASIVSEALVQPATIGQTFEVLSGKTPVREALATGI